MKEIKKYEIEDAEHKDDVIVSWIITHACPESCAYCISPNLSSEIISKEEHFRIQNQMIDTGLTKNRYIGGEPLMVPHLPELIRDAKEKGINTRLSTNGILLTKDKYYEMIDYLDSIAFPFESNNDILNRSIRGNHQHSEIIKKRIRMVKDTSNIGVLVNTCVHRENLGKLIESGRILADLGIDHWKLRKFSPSSGRGAVLNKDRFDISLEEFNEILETLKKLYPELKIDGRLPSKLATRLMVSPQGELFRMIGKEEDEIHYGKVLSKRLNIKEIYERDHCN